jgi:oxaloacetate decarboxylase (Na+ extruding) subunit alpha
MKIEFVDTTTRDGNQSLWGATGLTTPDVVSIAPTLDRVGYRALDFTTSTHMAVSVRFHHEDPWERIRLMRAAMPRTLLTFLTTGMRFISWEPAEEEVIRLAFRLVVRNGIRRVQIAEPMNDPRALAQIARIAKQEGAEEVVIGLTYSISEVHDDEHYATRATAVAAMPDVDRLYLKDPGGLLTVERVRELAPLFVGAFDGRPVELHSHCTIGLAPLAYLEGCALGFGTVHTAVAPLANGTSQPSTESTLRNIEASGFGHDLDTEALAAVSDHFRTLALERGLPLGAPAEYDAGYYHHQLPGGVVTTMRRHLEEMRRPELFDEAIEEIGRVRADFGYPIVVTPYAQFLVSQAVMNVIALHRGDERYADVPDEIVRYFLGHFGQPPAPPDSDVADRVLSVPHAAELRRLEPLSLEGARERFGAGISEEELLLRLTMPAEQVDAMVHGAPAERPGPRRSPLVTLLREIERRPSISYLSLAKGDTSLVWRRS